jgi:hypothetical protein
VTLGGLQPLKLIPSRVVQLFRIARQHLTKPSQFEFDRLWIETSKFLNTGRKSVILRFYFDLSNGDDIIRDDEGVDASSPDEAIDEARAALTTCAEARMRWRQATAGS